MQHQLAAVESAVHRHLDATDSHTALVELYREGQIGDYWGDVHSELTSITLEELLAAPALKEAAADFFEARPAFDTAVDDLAEGWAS